MQEARSRREFLAAIGTTTAVGMAGCLGLTREGDTVGMSGTEYLPKQITVSVGDTVVWENTSTRGHTVTASGQAALPEGATFFASGGFDSYAAAETAWDENFGGRLEVDDTFSHTFEIPCTYSYVCIPHLSSGMVGTVVVEE